MAGRSGSRGETRGSGPVSPRARAKRLSELMQAVSVLRDADECGRFFEDLCTPAELKSLADRWTVVQLVDREVPYREIHERTGVSTATVTRVGRALSYGASGYRMMLDRLGLGRGRR